MVSYSVFPDTLQSAPPRPVSRSNSATIGRKDIDLHCYEEIPEEEVPELTYDQCCPWRESDFEIVTNNNHLEMPMNEEIFETPKKKLKAAPRVFCKDAVLSMNQVDERNNIITPMIPYFKTPTITKYEAPSKHQLSTPVRRKHIKSSVTPSPFKKNPVAPRRFKSPYIFFFISKRSTVLKENPSLAFGEISRVIAKMWHDLSKTERKYWEAKSREDKVRYIKAKENFSGPWMILKDTTPRRRRSKMSYVKPRGTPNPSIVPSLVPSFIASEVANSQNPFKIVASDKRDRCPTPTLEEEEEELISWIPQHLVLPVDDDKEDPSSFTFPFHGTVESIAPPLKTCYQEDTPSEGVLFDPPKSSTTSDLPYFPFDEMLSEGEEEDQFMSTDHFLCDELPQFLRF